MFIIRKNVLYDGNGQRLKEVNCPKTALLNNLVKAKDENYRCDLCDHRVINTDLTSEIELTQILKEDPKTCLVINPVNPMFKFESGEND